MVHHCCSVCPATACCLMRATAGRPETVHKVVDVYNSATGAWSTAQLSVARAELAAASVGNLAMFAGGQNSGALLCRGGVVLMVKCMLGSRTWCIVAVQFALRPAAVSYVCHCRWLFQCCRCVQQCNRGMVDGSAQRGAL